MPEGKVRAEGFRLTERVFYDAFKASPIGIAVESLEGQPVFVNSALCSMLGFSEQELLDKHCVDFSPPGDAEKDWALFQQLRTGSINHYSLDKRYFRRDGSIMWGRLTISMMRHGETPLVLAMVQDITNERTVQEELRASEERLRLAQWAAHIGTFEMNIRTGVSVWTPELESIYGLSPGAFGRTQTAFENLVHPDDRPKIIELFDRALKTFRPVQTDFRVVWPDGSTHFIVGRALALPDETGQPSRMLGVNIDITEQKLIEQEFARINERFQLAIESGSVGGWDFNLENDENVWFGNAHAQLGMSPDETSGSRQEFWDRVHEDDREHLQNAMRLAKENHERFTEDFRVVWRDGTIHWLRSRGQFYYSPNGEPVRMLGISVDITQSKEAEQKLRESEQRFQLATQVANMYSFDWDVTTDVVVRSAERAEILGAPESRSSHKQFVQAIYPEDRPKFFATIAGLTPENPAGEVTYRIQASDGSIVWLKSTGRAFFDSQKRMTRVIGMVTEVTTLKRAEEALTSVTRKLVEFQEEERRRIARELHDDVNQRIALIAVSLQSLQQAPQGPDVDLRQAIGDATRELEELAMDVQALSHRLHSSKLEYLGLEGASAGLCREVSKRHKVEIDFRSENIPKDVPKEIALCLFRVLEEGLQNAIKHSGSRKFLVSLRSGSNEIELIVRDSGVGFDLQQTGKRLGLGLTSIEERAKLVNGKLSIDSQPQRGTTLRARVPFASKAKSADATG